MPEYITKERAMDCVYEAVKATDANAQDLYAIRRKIANEPGIGWVSVKDRMPPERDTIFAKLTGTKQWNPNMFAKASDDVRVAVLFEDGTRMVSHDHTFDGKWYSEREKAAYPKRTVTHWMENPKLPEDET